MERAILNLLVGLACACSASPTGPGLHPDPLREATRRPKKPSGSQKKRAPRLNADVMARIRTDLDALAGKPARAQAEYLKDRLGSLHVTVRSRSMQWVKSPAVPDYGRSSLTVASSRGTLPVIAWKATLPQQYAAAAIAKTVGVGDAWSVLDCQTGRALVADSSKRTNDLLLRSAYRGFQWMVFFHTSKADYDAAAQLPRSSLTGVLDILVAEQSKRRLEKVVELKTDIRAIEPESYENIIEILPPTDSSRRLVVIAVPYGNRSPANGALILELARRVHSVSGAGIALAAVYSPNQVLTAGAGLVSDIRAESFERIFAIGVDVWEGPGQPKSHLVAISSSSSDAVERTAAMSGLLFEISDGLTSLGYRVTRHSTISSGVENSFALAGIPSVTLRPSPDPMDNSKLVAALADVLEKAVIAAANGRDEIFSATGACTIPPL
jgi:hypothetical protein